MRHRGSRVSVLLLVGCVALAMPARAADTPTSVVGVLSVLQEDDFARGTTRKIYVVEEEITGQSYELRLDERGLRGPGTGARVWVRGIVRGEALHVADPDADVRMLERGVAEGVAGDERRAVVLVVDFLDSPVGCTDASITDLMFTGAQSVDGLYQESSFGEVSFPADTNQDGQPDVYRVTIGAVASDPCDANGWAASADAAAQTAGVDLSPYQHRVYVLPSNSTCTWAGLAHIGCFGTCRAWIDTCHLPDVYAHELGHNLGMGHASTDDDNDGTVDCEYCDRSDIMGIGGIGWRQVNGPHKLQKGWLSTAQVIDIDQQGLQTITLSPTESDPSGAAFPQLAHVARPGEEPYRLSYRVRTGYDGGLSGAYADRTNIHVHPGGASNTLLVGALQDGESFTDAAADIVITQVAHTAGSVTLEIAYACGGDPLCGGGGQPPGTVMNLRRTDVLP